MHVLVSEGIHLPAACMRLLAPFRGHACAPVLRVWRRVRGACKAKLRDSRYSREDLGKLIHEVCEVLPRYDVDGTNVRGAHRGGGQAETIGRRAATEAEGGDLAKVRAVAHLGYVALVDVYIDLPMLDEGHVAEDLAFARKVVEWQRHLQQSVGHARSGKVQ